MNQPLLESKKINVILEQSWSLGTRVGVTVPFAAVVLLSIWWCEFSWSYEPIESGLCSSIGCCLQIPL
jgi:hypothetical protein